MKPEWKIEEKYQIKLNKHKLNIYTRKRKTKKKIKSEEKVYKYIKEIAKHLKTSAEKKIRLTRTFDCYNKS